MIWNSLPEHIRNSCSLTIFRKQLKTHLFPLKITCTANDWFTGFLFGLILIIVGRSIELRLVVLVRCCVLCVLTIMSLILLLWSETEMSCYVMLCYLINWSLPRSWPILWSLNWLGPFSCLWTEQVPSLLGPLLWSHWPGFSAHIQETVPSKNRKTIIIFCECQLFSNILKISVPVWIWKFQLFSDLILWEYWLFQLNYNQVKDLH